MLPVSRSGATLTIAMTDPTNVFAMDDIKFMTGYNVEPVVGSESALDALIRRHYPESDAERKEKERAQAEHNASEEIRRKDRAESERYFKLRRDTDSRRVAGSSAPGARRHEIDLVRLGQEHEARYGAWRRGPEYGLEPDATDAVRLATNVLVDCLRYPTSCVHVEPGNTFFQVFFQVGDALHSMCRFGQEFYVFFVLELRRLANLGAEMPAGPEEGRILVTLKQGNQTREMDFSYLSDPTAWGPKLTLRPFYPAKP